VFRSLLGGAGQLLAKQPTREYGRAMNYPRRLRETVDYWAKTHPGSGLEELAVNFFTPKGGPDDVVMVVHALEEHQPKCVRSATRSQR
jgi:hypothetical protein